MKTLQLDLPDDVSETPPILRRLSSVLQISDTESQI